MIEKSSYIDYTVIRLIFQSKERLINIFGIQYIRELYKYTLTGLSQKLSEKDKISAQAISMWEQGKKHISAKRLEQLSEIFSIPQEYFSKELSDIDRMLIYNIKFQQELNSSVVMLEDYVYDEVGKEYKKIIADKHDYELRKLIEYNKIKIEALKTLQKINSIIFDESDSEKSFSNLALQVNARTILFRRFAEVIQSGVIPTLLLNFILRAVELAIDFAENTEHNEGMPTDKLKETQGIYQILREYLIEYEDKDYFENHTPEKLI